MSAARLTARVGLVGLALLASPARAHQGHGPRAAWDACEAAALDQECAYEDTEHATYRGSCRSMSGALICVRNRPIEPARAATPTPRTRSRAPLVFATLALPVGLLGLALLRRR